MAAFSAHHPITEITLRKILRLMNIGYKYKPRCLAKTQEHGTTGKFGMEQKLEIARDFLQSLWYGGVGNCRLSVLESARMLENPVCGS